MSLSKKNFPSLILCVSLTLIMCSSSMVHAQECKPEAVKLSKIGDAKFASGSFEDAAKLFTRAYTDCPNATLLKNSMIAWYKAKKCNQAIESAKDYLKYGKWPEPPTKEHSRDYRDTKTVIVKCMTRRIEVLLDEHELDDAQEYLKATEADGNRNKLGYSFSIAAEDVRALEVLKQRIAKARKEERFQNHAQEPSKPKGLTNAQIAGVALASLGTVALVGTGAFTLYRSGKLGEYNQVLERPMDQETLEPKNCAPHFSGADLNECKDLLGKITEHNSISAITAVAGGVALTTGLVLFFVMGPQDHEAQPLVFSPLIIPGGGGANVYFNF